MFHMLTALLLSGALGYDVLDGTLLD
jgi:hypothetical protein